MSSQPPSAEDVLRRKYLGACTLIREGADILEEAQQSGVFDSESRAHLRERCLSMAFDLYVRLTRGDRGGGKSLDAELAPPSYG